MTMNEAFVVWINSELDDRGWSRSEAARRGGISPSMFDKVVGGFANPGLKFCQAVSRAFRVPLDDVLARAGLLYAAKGGANSVNDVRLIYQIDDSTDRDRLGDLLDAYQRCMPSDQDLIVELCERLALNPQRIIGELEDEP